MSGVKARPQAAPPSVPELHARFTIELLDHVIAVACAPDQKTLAVAVVSGPLFLIDLDRGVIRTRIEAHQLGTTAVAYSADGTRLASAGQDGKVRLWDGKTGAAVGEFDGGAAWVEHLAWSPRQPLLAVAAGPHLSLWNEQGELVRSYPKHLNTIADVKWHPLQERFASVTYCFVTLWSAASSEPVQVLSWKGSMLKMVFSPDGRYLATGNQDGSVHFWVLGTGKDLEMNGYDTKVCALSFSATSCHLATGGGPAVVIWNISGKGPAGRRPVQIESHAGAISALAFQHKGALLASGGKDGLLFLSRPEGTVRARADCGEEITQLVWSPDDRLLAAGGARGRVTVFSA